jgi:hypothetical protein
MKMARVILFTGRMEGHRRPARCAGGRGAKFGKVHAGEQFHLCDGKDPDGNPIQLSNR